MLEYRSLTSSWLVLIVLLQVKFILYISPELSLVRSRGNAPNPESKSGTSDAEAVNARRAETVGLNIRWFGEPFIEDTVKSS